jgi:hypothetical protein
MFFRNFSAINVIRIGQVDQLGARLHVAVIPAIQAHAGVDAGRTFGLLQQVEEHELPRVQPETLVAQRVFHGSAERHELGFDALQLGQRAHGE